MDTARCVVTASFLNDQEAIRHLVEEESDPIYLIMALAQLNCQAVSRMARQQGEGPFEFWQSGLRRLAEHRSRR